MVRNSDWQRLFDQATNEPTGAGEREKKPRKTRVRKAPQRRPIAVISRELFLLAQEMAEHPEAEYIRVWIEELREYCYRTSGEKVLPQQLPTIIFPEEM